MQCVQVERHVITPLPEPPPSRTAGAANVAFSCTYEGALGASSNNSGSVLCLRVLRDAAIEGEWLRPVSRSSGRTPAKRARLSLAKQQQELEVFARVQGRVIAAAAAAGGEPSVDGSFCCYFDVLPVDGVLSGGSPAACHVHAWHPRERELRGQWVSQRDKPFWISAAAPCELFEQKIARAFTMVQTACSSSCPMRHASAIVKREPPAAKPEPAVASAWQPSNSSAAAASSDLRLYPLTPGVYEFTGFSVTAPPPSPRPANVSRRRRRSSTAEAPPAKDECFVTLRLLPDGKLQGTSRELLRPQSCRLTGSWRTNRVKYLLEYRVRDAVGVFKYSGRIEGDRKVLGKWYNVDDGHAEGYGGGRGEFELELTHAARVKKELSETSGATDGDDDTTSSKIRVLTTGAFTLKGCATDADGYEYACELVVELLPGGFLQGTSRELVFDQTRPVTGEWSPTFFRYRQEYVVKGDVGRYEYEGKLDVGDGGILSGDWGNMDLRDRESPGEHGTFAYGIVGARRRWSLFSHAAYPASFQRAVATLLLCSALPESLWYRTLAFCHESWFAGSTTLWRE